MLNEFVAFDLETTGLYPVERQQVIEYGGVRFRNGVAVEEFQAFVRLSRKLPPFIEKLTGITPKDLEGGLSEETAFLAFLDFVGDSPLVAHNMAFDFSFIDYLSRLYIKQLLPNQLVCTLLLARSLKLPISNRRLSTLAEHFSLPKTRAHRAVGDAQTAGLLYLSLATLEEECHVKSTVTIKNTAQREDDLHNQLEGDSLFSKKEPGF